MKLNRENSTPVTAKFILTTVLSIIGLIAIDRITKILAVSNLTKLDKVRVIPGLLDFVYAENTGISFGMFGGEKTSIVFILLTVLVVLLMLFILYYVRPAGFVFKMSLVLIIAGGIGNLIDRIFFGYVIDFLLFEFDWFPYVFNFADSCVVVGCIVLIITLLFFPSPKGKKDDVPA